MLYQNIMYGRVGKDWFRYCQFLFAARAKCKRLVFDYSKLRPPERRCERKPVWVVWEHLWPTPAAHTTSNYLTHCFDHLRRLLWREITVFQNLNILTNDACNGLRTSGISPIVCIPQSSAHPGTPPISTRFVLYHNQRFSWPYFRPIFKPMMPWPGKSALPNNQCAMADWPTCNRKGDIKYLTLLCGQISL